MPVATTERNGVVESVHHGAVVVLAADGRVAWTAGDPTAMVFARSALKPLQAAAMVGAGLDVADRLLAVVCASHDGRPEHLAAVADLLSGAGLDAGDLENTPAWPLDRAAHDDAVRQGCGPSAILQNCSGKHAGMLATTVVNGWPTAGYADVGHPLQQLIITELAGAVGEVGHVGVDGCGAPAPMVSLVALARAVRQLAIDHHAVYAAMTDYPELVGGPDRDVTVLMRLVPGLLVKDGAEGVQVAALADGRAVALKIADGAGRARTPVTIAALRSVGVALAADAVVEPVFGHGRPVGAVRSLVGLPVTGPEFATLDDVVYGRVERVGPQLRRVIAENPSKFTYRGTGTYLVGEGEVAVIDPGPLLDAHRDAIAVAIAGERVTAICVTHCHADHSPLAAWLAEETGAPTIAFGPHPPPQDGAEDAVKVEESVDLAFDPDVRVNDGAVAAAGRGWTLRAVHTPGHTSNHTCFAFEEQAVMFPGDHVMGWSTTVVSPPDGDMATYIDSLRKVAGRSGDRTYWPTHGPAIESPQRYVDALVEHRLDRERQVLAAVRDGMGGIPTIVASLYAGVDERLHEPAGRTVLAHLVKLTADGKVRVDTPTPEIASNYAPT